MLEFNKIFLFVILVLCLLGLGAEIFSIVKIGFSSGEDLWFQLILLFLLAGASMYLIHIIFFETQQEKNRIDF
ncbi:MAG: hypothetical protein WBN17_03695 [Aureibaculum sp.]